MRNFAVALLASTALTTVAHAQTAQEPAAGAPAAPAAPAPAAVPPPAVPAPSVSAPAAKAKDFGTVYSKAPETAKPAPVVAKPDAAAKPQDDAPAPKRRKVVKDETPVKSSAPATAASTPATNGDATGPALSSAQAIGSKAPVGSAPQLAPSQQSLDSFQPGSVVSDKVLRDVVQPSSDYNEAGKYTPGFYSNNANGPLGDSKSGWRGFKDGQFNITFDGVPFGDANDPSHHSAAYFPAPFIGGVLIDRGPGSASQVGYATFGGTMAISSRELSDKMGTEIAGSYGNFGTYTGNVTQQTGLIGGTTRAMAQYSYQKTDGALDYGHVDTNNFLIKLDTKINDNWTLTLLGTTGYENYNNTNPISWAQLQTFGRTYGQVNGNAKSQEFVGYNNSEKRTDMVYADLKGKLGYGITIENKVYTYAYDYPTLQNNGNDQSLEGNASAANGGTLGLTTSKSAIKITNPVGTCLDSKGVSTGKTCSTTVTFAGVVDGDVTGFKKNNNFRAYGDVVDLKRDVDAGFASGQFRTGFWWEQVDNHRYQQYYDYTQGKLYDQFTPTLTTSGATLSAAQAAIDKVAGSYKLDLDSHITNTQFYAEYEWKPMAGLSITPGFKHESFTRDHNAAVNQTTLQPANLSKTYDATLPFISVSQKLGDQWTVYGQASKGFLAPPVAAYYVYNFDSNDIRPETTTNLQAGVVYKSKNLTMSADVYRILSKDASSTTTGPDGTQILISNQDVRRQGIEGQATYAFGNGFGLFASGALMEAMVTNGSNNGLAYQNTPSYTAAGGALFDNGMFFGSLLYKVTGDQYGSGGQLAGIESNHVGSYNSTDAVIGMRVDAKKWFGYGEKAEIKLGVGNIFDNHNIVDIGGKPASNDPNTAGLSYTSQAGRVVYLGGKVNF